MIEIPPKVCILREAEYEDCEVATQLLRKLGLTLPVERTAVREHWRRFWMDNPALRVQGYNLPRGWLLENGERVVGFFANIPLLYDYGGRPIVVANASQWGVDADFREETYRLSEAYFNQKDADLLLVTTGIKPTGRIFKRYGGEHVPQPEYDQILFWVLNTNKFLRAGLKSKGLNSTLANLATFIGAPFVDIMTKFSGHRPKGRSKKIELLEIDDISDEFDGLWRHKRDETDRLLACRSAECLRWHFSTKSLTNRTRILVCRGTMGLLGYAIIMREDAPDIGLNRTKIVDLFVADDEETIVDELLNAAFFVGISEGSHVLELIGLPDHLRRNIISRHKPFSRRMTTWPIFYKDLNSGIREILREEKSWYITSYDGDTSIM